MLAVIQCPKCHNEHCFDPENIDAYDAVRLTCQHCKNSFSAEKKWRVVSAAHAKPAFVPRKPQSGGKDGLPDVGVLTRRRPQRNQLAAEIEARKIREKMTALGFPLEVKQMRCGYFVRRYECRMTDSSVSIQGVSDCLEDLVHALGVQSVSLPARIAVASESVVIDVFEEPTEQMRPLLGDVLSEWTASGGMEVCIGCDYEDRALRFNLRKNNCLLIAGCDRMAPAGCFSSIIGSLLFNHDSGYLDFLMIDTKRNLFEEYNRLPHLLAPPMDDPEYAMEALEWVCEEMDERFGVLRESGARDIASHNRMTDQAPMSNLVICINNYEHLMLEHAMAERFLVRLSAKSARVGISVIIATECPTADVVTRLIKANFTQRICFRTRNCNQSRMLLDDSSAVNLPGQGHVIMMNDDGIQRGFALELPEEDRRHLVDHYVRIHKDDWMEGLE